MSVFNQSANALTRAIRTTGNVAGQAGQNLGFGAPQIAWGAGQNVSAPQIQFGAGLNASAGQLSGTNLQPYMNPYTQGVINSTLNTMGQQFQQQQNDLDAQATAAGAFGGSRHGVAMGQAANAYQQNVANTVAGLNQSNYQQAQAAAQSDIANRMQAQQFNIGNALNTRAQNANLQAQADQFNAGNMLNVRSQNAANQLATNQTNASNRLAGMNTQLQAGSQLGNLSNLGFGMGQQINSSLNAAGTQQQQLIQSLLDAGRQQYGGYTGAGAQGLAGILSAIGGSPVPQSTTTSSNPGLLGILSGGASILGALCWVARSVYGTEDGKWLQFRKWLLLRAPDWLFTAYVKHGPAAAEWLDRNAWAKRIIRPFMDRARKQVA
ncbi:hypothetical protein PE067_16220 [Paracoccus sp. DMF-8]|uniref:hypothetical protein n=1 Tax=Paracoccus sp. DMF-8 TaxID=3019445 RepID=UPI0023E42DAB|nr:hypothetical protein [Paracoccus sp. DMF-8]MDF3607554.1 hypothetical protein [Paracoccus sp. DMF-8]